MERLDDDRASGREERLARVSYLPGVQPAVTAADETSSRSEVPDAAPALGGSTTWSLPPGADDAREADPAPVGAAHHVSITALARRGLSRREMERHLRDRGFEESEVADELARLEAGGYVDDVALAQTLVGTLQERKGLGRSAIAAELTRRLLAPAAIEYGLELIDTSDELSRARDLAVKRAGQLRGLDRDTAVRRLSAYLARRGYGGSTVRAAVDQALPAVPRSGVVFR